MTIKLKPSDKFKLTYFGTDTYIEVNDMAGYLNMSVTDKNLYIPSLPAETTVTFTVKDVDGKPYLTASYRGAVSGMPFYPRGCYNEADLKEISEDTKFYYLAGHNFNSEKISPEWQFIDGGGGIYTLDFTYNQHTDENINGGVCTDKNLRNRFRILSYTKNQSTPSEVTFTLGDRPTFKNGWERAGIRVRAVYNTNDNTLSFKPMRYAAGANGARVWEEADNFEDATPIPFISLVSGQWMQPKATEAGMTISDEKAGCNLPEQSWQNAWIQYNSRGDMVTSRDGRYVYYNTQWPPINPVYISKTFKIGDEEVSLTLDSDHLSFTPTGELNSGEGWKALYPDIVVNEANGATIDEETFNKTEYATYTVDDVWISGDFKLWSGWSGARASSNDNGAEWQMNWNWGHASESEELTNIDGNTTIFLGNARGDMGYSEPQYYKQIVFFMDMESDGDGKPLANAKGHSFLHLIPSLGGANIQAMSNATSDKGLFNPSITTMPEDRYISKIELTLHRSSNNALMNEWTFDTDIRSVDEFEAYWGTQFTPGGATGFFIDGFDYQYSGYYDYTMTLTFSSLTDADDTRTEVVKSNPFYISVDVTPLYVSQLVRVMKKGMHDDPEKGLDPSDPLSRYEFVTYTPGNPDVEFGWLTEEAHQANCTAENPTGLTRYGYYVEPLKAVPSAEFYPTGDYALWTDKMLIYSLRHWKGDNTGCELDENGAHGAYWELHYDGRKISKDEFDPELIGGKLFFFAPEQTQVGVDMNGQPMKFTINKMITKKDSEELTEEDITAMGGEYDGPLEFIYTAADVFPHTFTSKLHFYPSAEATTIEVSNEGSDQAVLRIPTPRMLPDVFGASVHDISEQPEKITLSATDYTGGITLGDEETTDEELEEAEYENPRVRALIFRAYLEMPNAHPHLLELIPDAQRYRSSRFSGDTNLVELLAGSRIDLKNSATTYFRLMDQDPSMWLTAETDADGSVKFAGKSRRLAFDFQRVNDGELGGNGQLTFYPRQRANGVAFKVDPNFVAPDITNSYPVMDEDGNSVMENGEQKMRTHRAYFAQVQIPGKNEFVERLVLAEMPVTPASGCTITCPAEEIPGVDNTVEFDIDKTQAYYRFTINGNHAHKINESMEDGLEDKDHMRQLVHHNTLTKSDELYLVSQYSVGPWWAGMENFHSSKHPEQIELKLSHAYFFRNNRHAELYGALSTAASNAPMRAPGPNSYVAFVGPEASHTIEVNEVMTGVSLIEAEGVTVVTGEGFIDLCGTKGRVCNAEGRVVYSGSDRVELPAGVYVVTTADGSAKVMVK